MRIKESTVLFFVWAISSMGMLFLGEVDWALQGPHIMGEVLHDIPLSFEEGLFYFSFGTNFVTSCIVSGLFGLIVVFLVWRRLNNTDPDNY